MNGTARDPSRPNGPSDDDGGGDRFLALIMGTAASDIRNGTADADQMFGLGGDDTLSGFGGDDFIDGGIGDDTLDGGDGDDILVAGAGRDVLDGGAGDDRIVLGDNDLDGDSFQGNAGSADTLDLTGVNWVSPVTINLATNLITTIGASAQAASFENIDGSSSSTGEILLGEHRANTINGNGGNDQIRGRDGDDTLSGGDGADVVSGGNDDDVIDGNHGDDELHGDAGDDVVDATSTRSTPAWSSAASPSRSTCPARCGGSAVRARASSGSRTSSAAVATGCR